MAQAAVKDQFENVAGFTIGIVTVDPRGDHRSIALRHGDTVWMTEEEQILTANAARDEAHNVLSNGSLRLIVEAQDMGSRRALRPTLVEEHGTTLEVAIEDAPEGTRPTEEETGTPTPQAPAPAPVPAETLHSAAPGNPKPPASARVPAPAPKAKK